jgi:hypothetical protein
MAWFSRESTWIVAVSSCTKSRSTRWARFKSWYSRLWRAGTGAVLDRGPGFAQIVDVGGRSVSDASSAWVRTM